jgi:hypothetical protein
MERVRMRSSSIVSAGYTPELSTLELEYCNGSLYEYFAVPKDVCDSLLTAESKGAFVAQRIRGRYPFRRVDR